MNTGDSSIFESQYVREKPKIKKVRPSSAYPMTSKNTESV